jgi:hypothetical protein
MEITSLILIIVAAVVILVLINLTGKTVSKGIDKEHFRNEWNDAVMLLSKEEGKELSVVNADKLLDEALKCMGFRGSTMGERLVAAKNQIKDKDAIWAAHKLRNKIVHETKFKPSDAQLKAAMKSYHKTFKDMGVL